jgi:pyruvate dehydrogenase E2 component (dihydrolipoamide acetyltransferase)
MATKVYMEALSPTMEEGRLITWLKNEGDPVKEGDVLAEVETDKATMELVARGAGVLRSRMIGEGDTANVGTVIGVIATEDEDISSLVGDGAVAGQSASAEEAPERVPSAEDAETEEEADVKEGAAAVAAAGQTEQGRAQKGTADRAAPGEQPTPTPDGKTRAARGEGKPSIESAGDGRGGEGGDGRVKVSPLARRLAAESGVELGDLQGSGPGGRIVKRDIEAAMRDETAPAAERAEDRPAKPSAPTAAPAAPQPAAAAAGAEGTYRDVPLSQMRKTIARRLTQSIGPVPHFFLTVDVDMGEAMRLRQRINERFAGEGVKVSPNDLVIRAVAAALRRHPWVNAAWTDQAVRLHDVVHIGVAVAVEEGLITPVVRNADRKGVTEIAREVKELAGRAREKKLKPEEYTGSTFSISNLGMFGIEEFTAVINPPEAAILAVGAVEDRVVVEKGDMVVRPRMRVTLSCDHRVIDGATGAQFLQTLKHYLEDPTLMIA